MCTDFFSKGGCCFSVTCWIVFIHIHVFLSFIAFHHANNTANYELLERAVLDRSPLKITLWWFLPKEIGLSHGEKREAWEFLYFSKWYKIKPSLASPWYELWPRILCLWKQHFLWHSTVLILCSNLGNCLNHRELIPVMPLPPPPVLLALIHPEYQPSPTIFRSPGPYWYLSASTLKMDQFLSAHTF